MSRSYNNEASNDQVVFSSLKAFEGLSLSNSASSIHLQNNELSPETPKLKYDQELKSHRHQYEPGHSESHSRDQALSESSLNSTQDFDTSQHEHENSMMEEPIFGPLLPSQRERTCWRAPKAPVNKQEELHARRGMISILEQRLIAKCQKNGTDDEQIHETARALEHLLFKQARDLISYRDEATLDERLRGLMTILVRKKMMNKSKCAMKQRTQYLVEIMGLTKYKHCKALVSRIKIAMATKVAKLRCNSQLCTRPMQSQMPKFVRDLYFETPLVDAFEKQSMETLGSVDWDRLIENANINLQQFQTWEEGQTATFS